MKFPLTFIFLLITSFLFAQQNLVPNPSFEDTINCPQGLAQFWSLQYWREGYNSPDYFNECAIIQVGVPSNIYGYQFANNNGVAYAGINIFHILWHNGREYIEVKLADSLIANKRYNVEFYISLADSMKYAIWNIGAFFSDSGVYGHSLSQILTYIPQVTNQPNNFITDKNGWTRVNGSFAATGGEKYITIGNFEDDSVIDTLFVGGSSNNANWRGAYYYIDDVAVYEDTTVDINEININKENIEVFPNPVKDKLTIGFNNNCKFELYNLIGAKIKSVTLDNGSLTKRIDLTDIDNGLYFYSVVDMNGNRIKTGKLIIIK